MRIQLPQYTSRDYKVLAVILLPVTLIINSIIFGARYYSEWQILLFATAATGAGFCINFIICGWVAVQMKKRFPAERQLWIRLTLMIISFILFTGLFLVSFFKGYEAFSFLHYTFNERGFIWAYVCMAIINIFITLLMEDVARLESWKQKLEETEQLKKTFRQSQLQGLKSQVNPHFLFNSLNTLSSLISEDEEKAENFLNEMTKVYRYMLRSDDEQLVTLDTELKFIESYLYLLKARFGVGLQTTIAVDESDRSKLLPALSLQVLIENAFTKNSVSKLSPLSLEICSCMNNSISLRYNKQEKAQAETAEVERELENLVKKYSLLNRVPLTIEEKKTECCFFLPLLTQKEEVEV